MAGLFVLFSLSNCNAQNKTLSTITEAHVLLKGTNIYMVPPPGFIASKNFKGFEKTADAASTIMATELKAPFVEVTAGFTKEMMQTRGITLLSKEETNISGMKGILLKVNQNAGGLVFSKYILVYGNNNFSQMINGVFPADSTATGNAIRKSLLTLIADTNMVVDVRQGLDYSLTETGTDLKFHSVSGNVMLFNRDGKTPTQSPDKVSVIADRSFQKQIILDRKKFCEDRLRQLFGDKISITPAGIKPITIDGINGYELFAQNLHDTNEKIYEAILFPSNGGYYIFLGTYHKSYPKAEEDVLQLVRSFKVK